MTIGDQTRKVLRTRPGRWRLDRIAAATADFGFQEKPDRAALGLGLMGRELLAAIVAAALAEVSLPPALSAEGFDRAAGARAWEGLTHALTLTSLVATLDA